MVSLIFFNIRKGYVDDGEGEKLTLLFQLWTSDYAPSLHSCLLRDSRAVGILIPVPSFALHFVGGEERSPIGVRLNARLECVDTFNRCLHASSNGNGSVIPLPGNRDREGEPRKIEDRARARDRIVSSRIHGLKP